MDILANAVLKKSTTNARLNLSLALRAEVFITKLAPKQWWTTVAREGETVILNLLQIFISPESLRYVNR